MKQQKREQNLLIITWKKEWLELNCLFHIKIQLIHQNVKIQVQNL